MEELEKAFDAFADAVEDKLRVMQEENRQLRALVDGLQLQVRSAPTLVEGPPGPKGDDGVGEKGDKGDRGNGIKSAEIVGESLWFKWDDGTMTQVGQVVGARGADGKDGKDGQHGEGKDGRDGVNGKDGRDGKDGMDGKAGERGTDGKDGLDGKDGQDGEDGVASVEEIEAIVARAVIDLQTRTLADAYRGVWSGVQVYPRGALVNREGGLFLAVTETETRAQPGASKDWVLVTKRGRDGKDAK